MGPDEGHADPTVHLSHRARVGRRLAVRRYIRLLLHRSVHSRLQARPRQAHQDIPGNISEILFDDEIVFSDFFYLSCPEATV